MSANMSDIATQRTELAEALKTLAFVIQTGLPSTFTEGTPDGPIAQYFTDIDVDPDWPYEAVDRAWVRVFQVTSGEGDL